MLSAELRVASGKQKGKAIPLKIGKFMVGRGEDCHLRPNNELVSRHHCVFTVDEFVVRLRDLGSTNGTIVNGERIRGQVILNQGDKVGIGKLEFEVSLKGAMVTAPIPVGTVLDTDSSAGDIPLQSTRAGQKLVEHPAESDTAMLSHNKTVTIPVFTPTPEPEMVEEEEPAAEIDEEQGTAYEMPAAQPMMPPGPAYGGFGQMMPGMPYGAPQPMYPQMPMGYGGYPNYPAMPPMMYPQYPPQGYAPMPQPPYGAPQQMPQAPAAIEEEEQPAVVERKVMPTRLPDPKETGAKAAVPPEKKAAAAGGAATTDPRKAATEILKQMSQRRPT
jgi:pSer/pThr/pTyr-binding forkhead associated (FHA) protein